MTQEYRKSILSTVLLQNNVVKQKYYKKKICTQLDFVEINRNTKVKDYQVVITILYRLKTGCQWRQLPLKQFFRERYSWQSVYYHFQKWSKNGSWGKFWNNVIKKHKHLLDLSSMQLEGTHTPAKRSGESLAYRGPKKSKTTNTLIITDSKTIPLACSDLIADNHNYAFNLVKTVGKIINYIQLADIPVDGLFLNADSVFDTSDFHSYCYANEIFDNIDRNIRNGNSYESNTVFDQLLYKVRFVIERTNAWLDAFKAILVRFETRYLHCKSLLLLAFLVILLQKL